MQIYIFKIFNFLNQKEEFKNEEFYKNSKNSFINFKNSIEKDELSCSQLSKLKEVIKDPNFKDKIKFFKFNEEQFNNFVERIDGKYEFIENISNKFNECKKYLSKIGNNIDKKFISKINAKERFLKQNSFGKFKNNIKENSFLVTLNKIHKRSQKYQNIINLQLKSISTFVKDLENRVDGEEANYQYLEKKINKMKYILSKDALKEFNELELEEFILVFSNKKELKEEINKIKKFFKCQDDTAVIEKYLSLKYKKLKLLQTLTNFIETIIRFNLIQTDFFDKLKELKQNISNLSIQKKFDEEILNEMHKKIDLFISNLENIDSDLKLKLEPIDFISFIVNVFGINSLLKFIFEISSDDLIDITNSISSNLDIYNIINEYQIIINIVEELKQKCGIKEKNYNPKKIIKDIDFFKSLLFLIQENLNGKTIEEFKNILENCAKNQPKLLDLLENKKGWTKNKEDIKDIIKDSKFSIYQDKINPFLYSSLDSKYACSCEFKNKTKIIYLKDLILLQQLASLSQFDEKQEKNRTLDIFIDLIENKRFYFNN